MQEIYKDSNSIVFADNNRRVVITRNDYNNCKNAHYNVFVKEGTKKGKVVATRCNLETALNFAK